MPMTEYAAQGGTAIAELDDATRPTTPPTGAIHDGEISEIAAMPITEVVASPFNPRKTYSQAAMDELVASVRAVGVMQPILVRANTADLGSTATTTYHPWQVVFGHRRLMAAQAAGLATIPVMVRELTDTQAAQLQAVENLQREDLTALDEAQGYAAYISAHGITKDQLAERIGKSRTHVYNRLKLAELVPPVAQALQDGKIGSATAEHIARIPAKHQPKALAIALETYPHATVRPHRKVRDELLEKFTLDLKGAIFDTADAVLVELAGACTTCPKRSGQTPELFGDIITRPDREPLYKWGKSQHGSAHICTDPDCFAEKKKAHLANARKALEAKGATVVAGSAALASVDSLGNVKGAYVAVSDVRAELKKVAADKKPTIVTIQNPRDGSTVQAVKRADLADAGGKVEVHAKTTDRHAAQRQRDQEPYAKKAEKAKAMTAHNLVVLAAVRSAAGQAPRTAQDLRMIAQLTWQAVEWDDMQLIAQLYNFKHPKELEDRIAHMDVDALGRFCLDCALVQDVHTDGYNLKPPENLLAAAKQYGIDPKSIKAPAATPEQALADAVGAGDDDGEANE